MTTTPVQLGSVSDVFPIALGCMGMSGMYGPSDEAESIATIHAALERGVNLLDTGDFYGMGHNELLIAKALRAAPDRGDAARLSVKFGALRGPDGTWLGVDGRPAAVKNFLAHTLTRLGVDHIDIYRPARLDPNVPIEDTIGAIADCVKAGWVRAIGLSEVGVETIRRAHAVHPICDLQIEYAIVSRKPEEAIFPVLAELGIGVTAYGVLSRGLLSGSQPAGRGDYRAYLPRFTGEAGASNARLVATLQAIGTRKGISGAQLAIAWVLAKSHTPGFPVIVPTLGARRRSQLDEALAALAVSLTSDEMAAIEAEIPATAITGTRYAEAQMRHLDSER